MLRGSVILLLAGALIAISIFQGKFGFVIAWFGINFLLLGVAHFSAYHKIFGKRADGVIPWWSWCVFLPLQLYTHGVWHVYRLINRENPTDRVTDFITIGRRLLPGELEGSFANYVDLASEFTEPEAIRKLPGYLSVPILDASAPPPAQLKSVVDALRPGQTFIHCAQGHGRTGLFTIALLIALRKVSGADEGIALLKKARPGVSLNATQRACLRRIEAMCDR